MSSPLPSGETEALRGFGPAQLQAWLGGGPRPSSPLTASPPPSALGEWTCRPAVSTSSGPARPLWRPDPALRTGGGRGEHAAPTHPPAPGPRAVQTLPRSSPFSLQPGPSGPEGRTEVRAGDKKHSSERGACEPRGKEGAEGSGDTEWRRTEPHGGRWGGRSRAGARETEVGRKDRGGGKQEAGE